MSGRSSSETQIGRGTVIRGTVRGTGDLEIEGTVEGVLDVSGDVTIADTARIRMESGSLKGARVTVRGAIAGSIEAETAILLEEGARVVGDLTAPSIGIRPGGMVRGFVATGDASESDAPTKNRAQLKAAPSARAEARPAAAPAPRPAPAKPPPATQRAVSARVSPVVEEKAVEIAAPVKRQEAPAPVMPAIRKGQKGQMKRKAGGR